MCIGYKMRTNLAFLILLLFINQINASLYITEIINNTDMLVVVQSIPKESANLCVLNTIPIETGKNDPRYFYSNEWKFKFRNQPVEINGPLKQYYPYKITLN